MTKEDINKACKWLEKNLVAECNFNEYAYISATNTVCYDTVEEFIKHFKKAMEE